MRKQVHSDETRKRYPVLAWYSSTSWQVVKVMAILAVCVMVVSTLAGPLVTGKRSVASLVAAWFATFAFVSPVWLLVSLNWVVGAEVVRLLLDIEDNGAHVARAMKSEAERRAAKKAQQQGR